MRASIVKRNTGASEIFGKSPRVTRGKCNVGVTESKKSFCEYYTKSTDPKRAVVRHESPGGASVTSVSSPVVDRRVARELHKRESLSLGRAIARAHDGA